MRQGLTDISKAASRIAKDGLYGLILENMEAGNSTKDLGIEKIEQLLLKNRSYLDEYRRTNQEHNVSNIDVVQIEKPESSASEHSLTTREINKYLSSIKELERFASPAGSLVYGLWIGSAVAMLVFAVHNFFAMFTNAYKEYPSIIYALYLGLCLGGFLIHFRMVKSHNQKFKLFEQDHQKVLNMIEQALRNGELNEQDISFRSENTPAA